MRYVCGTHQELDAVLLRNPSPLFNGPWLLCRLVPQPRASAPRDALLLPTRTSRLFQPVQYGQKPEGRTVAFPSTHPPRTAASTAATATPQGHVRGRPPIATFSANPDAKGRPRVGVLSVSWRVFVEDVARILAPLDTWLAA